MIGENISHYRIVAKIGAGGMGVVYRAHDPRLDREVAVKVLPNTALSDPARLGRFEREARSTGALNHPNIVAIYDVGQHEGAPFIVTELLEGSTLRRRIKDGDLTLRRAVEYGIQIADGLAAAHSKGIIHRDLKPENVFVTQDGHVKILDFGLAKLHQQDSSTTTVSTAMTPTVETETGAIVGTLGYMSPEQLHGRTADQRSDIFAFGALMYEMLCGRRAFAGDSKATVMASILRDDPPALSELSRPVPPQLEALVRRCLDKRPEDRFESAHDLALALRAILDAGDWSASTLKMTQLKRRTWTASVGVAVAVAATVATVWILLRDRAPPPAPPAVEGKKAPIAARRCFAVLPFSGSGADPETSALSRGLAAVIADAFVAVEERTGGEMWAVPPRDAGSGGLDRLRRQLGVTAAIGGELEQESGGWRLRLTLLDAATAADVDQDELVVNGGDSCALAARAARDSLELAGAPAEAATETSISVRLPRSPAACGAYLEGLGWRVGGADRARLEAAVAHLGRAATEDPLHGPTLVALAGAYRELFEITDDPAWAQRGLDAANRALTLHESDPDGWVALARLQHDTGLEDESIASLERAAACGPHRADIHSELGRRYKAAGRPDDAERALQRAIRLRPGDITPKMVLGELHWVRGERDAAINQFREAIDLAPDNTLAYSNLCGVYLSFEMKEEARAMCERSLAIEPTYEAYSNLGTLAFFSSNFGEAVAMFERAHELGEGDYLTYGNLGLAYHHMDRALDSRRALERARELAEALPGDGRSNPSVMVDVAVYNALLGDRERALDVLGRATSLDIEDPLLMALVGEAYEDAGERDQALQWVGRAFDNGLDPSWIENSPTLRRLGAFRELAEQYVTDS